MILNRIPFRRPRDNFRLMFLEDILHITREDVNDHYLTIHTSTAPPEQWLKHYYVIMMNYSK